MASADFVPLADVIRQRTNADNDTAAPATCEPDRVVPIGTGDHDARADVREAVRAARLFRARLADAFDDSAAHLLRELAAGVLARELRLAPCDVAAIVRRIAERAPVVRVRLAPADVSRCTARDLGITVVEDRALDAGDAVLELAGGAVDARLGVRLAAVLEDVA